jgi:hypothetical protein
MLDFANAPYGAPIQEQVAFFEAQPPADVDDHLRDIGETLVSYLPEGALADDGRTVVKYAAELPFYPRYTTLYGLHDSAVSLAREDLTGPQRYNAERALGRLAAVTKWFAGAQHEQADHTVLQGRVFRNTVGALSAPTSD